jgi:RNA polymerase sigma-70 factor, ECF subfamily
MPTKAATSLNIEDFVYSYYPAVVRLATSILDDGRSKSPLDEAEDAAQETFIAASRALADFRGDASPKTWLFTIAINICRSRLRRRNTRRLFSQAVELFEQRAGGEADPQSRYEIVERDAGLWREIDALDEKHRLVVVLHYVHELPTRDIAQVLGINEGTVHSRLYHARQHLAGRLKRSVGWEEAVIR